MKGNQSYDVWKRKVDLYLAQTFGIRKEMDYDWLKEYMARVAPRVAVQRAIVKECSY